MSELLDRFFELEARIRWTLCAVAAALVFVGYWYLIYSGRRAEMATLNGKIVGLRAQVDTKNNLVANLDAVRATVRELTAQVRQAEQRLPDEKEIPELLSSVSSAGRESGLEVMLFRQKAERYQDFYAEVPVDVLVRGNYHQVAAFFDRVGQLDRIVNVGDISMRLPRDEGSAMIVDTSCSAVTFRFLDEEERARIAKEKAEQQKKAKGSSGKK
jgi:type IV pilus assembly protein PilO